MRRRGDLARRLAGEGRFGEAYLSLEDLVGRGEATAEDCLRLGWLGYAIDDQRALETWCHEAERLWPEWAEPHLALGWAVERSGRLPEALEEYDAALRRGWRRGEGGMGEGEEGGSGSADPVVVTGITRRSGGEDSRRGHESALG